MTINIFSSETLVEKNITTNTTTCLKTEKEESSQGMKVIKGDFNKNEKLTKNFVIKRNGEKEPLDLSKIHKVVSWACEGISGVSQSEIEIKAKIQFYDGIKTSEIQETLIKAASELISEETPNYQYVASRLVNYHLRKQVYNSINPPHLYDHYKKVLELGYYDNILDETYTKEEFDILNRVIDHSRDYNFSYAGIEQLRGKYLIKNRVTGQIFETPQMAFALISMMFFHRYPKNSRMKFVKDFYHALSSFEISLPTPILAGLRSKQRQYSSCVLIETDDSIDSISATVSSILHYVSRKAGIGIGAGKLRALGSPVRNGEVYHTGVIPFYRLFDAAVRSVSQGGVRGGSATLYYPIWHLEVEDLIVLKNNKGTEENRIRHMDYGVQINRLFYERLIKGENITLFSPSDVPGLYESFFNNYEKFKELYENAEKNPNIRKKEISALELFSKIIQERKDTGRIYIMNVDNANEHGSFIPELAPIRQSNLCAEIDLPTKPLKSIDDENGEISLCTLGAINWGKINKPEDFQKPCSLLVRALDELLDFQDYPVKAAELSTKRRRPLGIGITNFAYWMAKNDLKYQNITKEGLEKIQNYVEAWSYYLIQTSIELAEEKGACKLNHETKYSKGIFPIHTYKKDVDEIVSNDLKMDWNDLVERAKRTGIRNSTLMACMPCESSSLVNNSTNGIEPVRSLVTVKISKDGVLKQVVPEIKKLKNKYDLLWNQISPEGYLKICAVLQKFIDQGISVNTSYNPKHYDMNMIPLSEMLRHLILFYKFGGKQLYYNNTYDAQGELLDYEEITKKNNNINNNNIQKNEESLQTTSYSSSMVCSLDDENCESCKL